MCTRRVSSITDSPEAGKNGIVFCPRAFSFCPTDSQTLEVAFSEDVK